MLKRVPEGFNKAHRAVVLRHPNSMDATVYRKSVMRSDDPAELMGALPTLEGLGILSSEYEEEVTWNKLGEAKAIPLEPYQQSGMSDRVDSVAAVTEEQIFAIECVVEADDPEYFTPKKQDVLFLLPGAGIAIAFEIVNILAAGNIPPFTKRYVVNPRDDLSSISTFSEVQPIP